MNTLQKIETTETGLNLYFGTYGICVPFEVAEPTWEKAKEIATERGHELPSPEQGLAVIENTDEINKALCAAGKPEFDDWFWLNREHSTDPRFAWCVDTYNGNFDYDSKGNTGYVRAVSAFVIE